MIRTRGRTNAVAARNEMVLKKSWSLDSGYKLWLSRRDQPKDGVLNMDLI